VFYGSVNKERSISLCNFINRFCNPDGECLLCGTSFLLDLFNDVFSNSVYAVSNVRLLIANYELEMIRS
jgi:hypothetical protein